jgi:hypothetical protein
VLADAGGPPVGELAIRGPFAHPRKSHPGRCRSQSECQAEGA